MTLRCPRCQAEITVGDETRPHQLICSSCGAELAWRPKASESTRCPACGTVAPPGAVICVECGLNLKTGTPTRISPDDEQPDEEAPPSAPMRALMFVAEWMPGLLRPLVLVASIVASLLGLGLLIFGLALFFSGIGILAGMAAGGVGVIVFAQGIAWLIDGSLVWLTDALVEFDGPRWGIFFVLLATPFVALFLLIRLLTGGA